MNLVSSSCYTKFSDSVYTVKRREKVIKDQVSVKDKVRQFKRLKVSTGRGVIKDCESIKNKVLQFSIYIFCAICSKTISHVPE